MMSHRNHKCAIAKGGGSLISNTTDLGTQKQRSHTEAQMQERKKAHGTFPLHMGGNSSSILGL